MKTILVLAPHPSVPDTMRTGLDPARYRIIHRRDIHDIEPFFGSGLADGCVVDLGGSDVRGMWVLERLRSAVSGPLVVLVDHFPWEWEEEAYLTGVDYVLTKPLKRRMIGALLDRYWVAAETRLNALPVSHRRVIQAVEPPAQVAPPAVPTGNRVGKPALEVLRTFSSVLTHSLEADALLKKFLLLLREIIGVNRAAIFLHHPNGDFAGTLAAGQRLRSSCAIGLSPGLLEHFELSFESGMGGELYRSGRILRRESQEAMMDPQTQKEFEILGVQVAVPMLDRENLVGIATFDGRLTGEPLANSELELIFHLLEELGLAVKNIWLHEQLSGNHETMSGILQQLSSACIVVGRDLNILHANKRATSFFDKSGRRRGELEFSDLPDEIGSKAYQVLQNGIGLVPFRYENKAGTAYQVTVVPFQKTGSVLPASVLIVVEDLTQSEQLQALKVEAANLRLVSAMADRLAHEVGNSLVPLTTHQQLLKEKYKDPEFMASLDIALSDGVKRISRLASQMRFLALDSVASKDAIPLAQLLEEAHSEAQKHHAGKATRLKCDAGSQPIILSGDRAALRHAFAEVMLNAIQANPEESKVGVRFHSEEDTAGANWVQIDIQDTGPGLSADRAEEVLEPFITDRNVGLGLGLTVSRKIIETHRGHLALMPSQNGHSGGVKIRLPLESQHSN